jgi:hypothetical protein
MIKRPQKNSHRFTSKNDQKTLERIQQYHGLVDLLKQPEWMQANHHQDILKLKARVRMVKNLVIHRAGGEANL